MDSEIKRTVFKEVLLDPFSFPETHTLYLREGREWDLDQEAIVIDPDAGEDSSTVVGELVEAEQWQYILEIAGIRGVMRNLMDLLPQPDLRARLAAFVFYYEHDAFASQADLE